MKSSVVAQELEKARRAHGLLQFLSPGGNGGDSLIDVGFIHLVEELGIPYRLSTLDSVDDSGAVVLSGGGGMVPEHPTSRMIGLIEDLHPRVQKLIILPQTIIGHEQLLGKLGDNVTLFARERRTSKHIDENCVGGARTLLDHDMAFNVDVARLLSDRQTLPVMQGAKDFVRLAYYAAARGRAVFQRSIDVFRVDGEASQPGISRSRLNDVSMITAFRGGGISSRKGAARMFLTLLNQYQFVRTDRLHVAIAASLLRKEVSIVNNSNGKLIEVYKYSMQEQGNVRVGLD